MKGKKKPVRETATTSTASAGSLEDATPAVERRPSFTQVVEVVEEVPDETPMPKKEMLEEPVPAEQETAREQQTEPEENVPSSDHTEDSDEKKRELVDEIFQKDSDDGAMVSPEISMHTRSSTKPVYLWAIGLVVACIVIGSLLLLSSKKNLLPSIVIIPSPTPTTTPKPTSTPTPQMTRESLTVQVLNGGGKAGAATKMKKFLEDKGYKVTDTGNADNYNYDKTEILVKADKQQYISLLSSDLKDSYTLGTAAATLETGVSYDARVIVGKE